MASFMKKAMPMMSCRKFFSKSGTKRVVIHPTPENHSGGWSLLPGALIDRLRRRQAYSRARERYEERVIQESQTPRREGSEKLILNDLRKFLNKSIRALPRFQREAVELAFFNGLSHREIAAVTHAPLGTVKTRLELGLQKLTSALSPLRHKV